jgi:hypothetical protein
MTLYKHVRQTGALMTSFIFLNIFINLFKTSYMGDAPVGERTLTVVVVFFLYKIIKNKKIKDVVVSGALPFIFLKS